MNGALLTDLETLLGARISDGDGYTTQDICEATGKNPDWVRTALREALKQGVWERTQVKRENLSGHMMTRVAFRPKKKKKKS